MRCLFAHPPTHPPGSIKRYGGVLGSDGCIYGMPCNADCVLKIKPAALVDKGKSKKGDDNSAAGSARGGSEVCVELSLKRSGAIKRRVE